MAKAAHQLKKSFGQHFLVDRDVIDQIVAAISPKPNENLIEIGPGAGALTATVLKQVSQLHAVELDRDLISPLNQKFAEQGLVLHQADVLEFNFAELFSSTTTPWRVFGNLPYNISSPILFHLLPVANRVVDQFFMLQKEVVDRMVAEPGNADYGRLSVMMQARYHLSTVCVVEPQSFNPPPKVRSAVVRMKPHNWYEGLDWQAFEALIKAAFSQRRKMLRNTLADYHARVPLEQAGISPTARAEEVSVEQFVAYCGLSTKSN